MDDGKSVEGTNPRTRLVGRNPDRDARPLSDKSSRCDRRFNVGRGRKPISRLRPVRLRVPFLEDKTAPLTVESVSPFQDRCWQWRNPSPWFDSREPSGAREIRSADGAVLNPRGSPVVEEGDITVEPFSIATGHQSSP